MYFLFRKIRETILLMQAMQAMQAIQIPATPETLETLETPEIQPILKTRPRHPHRQLNFMKRFFRFVTNTVQAPDLAH